MVELTPEERSSLKELVDALARGESVKGFINNRLYEELSHGTGKDEFGNEIKPVEGGVGIGSVTVDLKPLTEEEIQQFRDLTDEVSRVWETDQSLFEIIDEETKPFFAGDKSADETAKTIQNRATTYLNESK